jgi:hypothetical protein
MMRAALANRGTLQRLAADVAVPGSECSSLIEAIWCLFACASTGAPLAPTNASLASVVLPHRDNH